MQHILLKFGLCHLFILDDDFSFKRAFVAMCEVLNLNHDVLMKRNYKGLTVKYIHRFLNKSVSIAAGKRDTKNMFVLASVVVGYTWNIASIDSTCILTGTPTIGRELYFPLDASLNSVPKLTQNNGQAALDYLKLTDSSRYFSTFILKFLLIIVVLLTPIISTIIKTLLFKTVGYCYG